LGHDLLRRIHADPGHLRQSLESVLVGTQQMGDLQIELAHPRRSGDGGTMASQEPEIR
jgi:hypothetical protein